MRCIHEKKDKKTRAGASLVPSPVMATNLRLVVHYEDSCVGHRRYTSACRSVEKGNKGLVALNIAFATVRKEQLRTPEVIVRSS